MRHLTQYVLILVLLALPALAQRTPNSAEEATLLPSANLCAAPAAAQIAPNSAGACPKNTSKCGGACVDRKSDLDNCGKCGRICKSGQMCVSGKCRDIPTCTSGQTLCGARCVYLDSDRKNCGACGDSCRFWQECSSGKCKDSGIVLGSPTSPSPGTGSGSKSPTDCGPGETWCHGSCTNDVAFLNDDNNCGRCNHSCSFGESCTGGMCDCGAGSTRCNGSCVNSASFLSDDSNCGSCNHFCHSGEQCLGGSCRKLQEQSVAGSRKSAAPPTSCGPGDIACMERTLTR